MVRSHDVLDSLGTIQPRNMLAKQIFLDNNYMSYWKQAYIRIELSRGPCEKTKPYLSLAGPIAFDHWNKYIGTCLKTAFPSVHDVEPIEISQDKLVTEILNVMIAVPSVNFMLDLVSL